jgi:exodeoxyribonuclease III
MKICSRNVNGIRAVLQKGFIDRFRQEDPDILCLQEVKAFEYQIPAELKYLLSEYNYAWHAGSRPWYAWVATFWKKSLAVDTVTSTFEDIQHFHQDGRVVEISFWQIVLLNIYFPNWWERADGTEMLSYKLHFYDTFLEYIDALRASWKKIITTGDFNICHQEIDIARPKENENSIGFLPIERAKMDDLVAHGYVDVFRHFYPTLSDHYTWWSYRAGARPRNVWRRLDYFWVSQELLPLVSAVQQQDQIMGSDHCPISMILRY